MPFNLATYETQKKNNAVRMIRVSDDVIAVVMKKFHPDTGEPAPDSIENVSIAELDKTIKNLETDLQRFKDMRADFDKV